MTSVPAPLLVRPSALHPGDTIGLIAPASAPKTPADLERGIAYLENLGYKIEQGRTAITPHGYFAGSDTERIDELNGFLRRPDIKSLFCVRGGYGVLRLLPHLDYESARQYPKLIVGYSDITALHCALYQQAGLPGLSGAMVASEWGLMDEDSERLFWEMMSGATPQPLIGPGDEPLQPMRPGRADGVLIGGNLAVLTRLIGTPYLPSLEGAILFLEEVGEAPYRIDGMLAQLKLCGILDRLGGLVLGGFTEWEPDHNRPTFTPDEVFAHFLSDAAFPIATGLVYGHFPTKNALPFGVRARLEVEENAARLSILEAVVQ